MLAESSSLYKGPVTASIKYMCKGPRMHSMKSVPTPCSAARVVMRRCTRGNRDLSAANLSGRAIGQPSKQYRSIKPLILASVSTSICTRRCYCCPLSNRQVLAYFTLLYHQSVSRRSGQQSLPRLFWSQWHRVSFQRIDLEIPSSCPTKIKVTAGGSNVAWGPMGDYTIKSTCWTRQ